MSELDPAAVMYEHAAHVNGHCVLPGQLSLIGSPERRASAMRYAMKQKCEPYLRAKAQVEQDQPTAR